MDNTEAKYTRLKKYEVAFRLNNSFHANFAMKTLLRSGEKILESPDEHMLHPKTAEFYPYLICGQQTNKWLTARKIQPQYTILTIEDLIPYLESIGINQDEFKRVTKEIDELSIEYGL